MEMEKEVLQWLWCVVCIIIVVIHSTQILVKPVQGNRPWALELPSLLAETKAVPQQHHHQTCLLWRA